MTPILMKTAAAIAAVAGLAVAPFDPAERGAYDGSELTRVARADIVADAKTRFARADMDQSGALDADEYTALAVVTAELAQLNGFIVVEKGEDYGIVALPGAAPSALPPGAHDRIAAVAQNQFYVFAGEDGLMQAEEFKTANLARFDTADRNANAALARGELAVFAMLSASIGADS